MPDKKEGYSNLEMLKNQANTIAHHAKEFKEAVDKSEDAMPWEVAKAMRASTDLSDITHYREGEADSYAKGGQMDFDIDDFDAPHELAKGGKLEVGKTYRAKDGNSYRYVGGDYFLDAQRNYVKKGRDDFEGYFFEEGGTVDADSVVPGARFKNPSGTVFIVDKVLLEKSSVRGEDIYFVHSSLEGGQKGNYRDPLDEFVAIMNEEKATPVMAGGGEAEDGGFYIYGKTQRDNYDIANMLRELEIQFEWQAGEGRFRVVEDDEYGDLAFRLQVEMDDRPVYGRIERVMKWGGYAEDGMAIEEEDDLFDRYEELPDEVHEVLDEYENKEPNASNVEDMRGRLNALGYDFEYGLDYSPYGLRKMAKGGGMTAKGDSDLDSLKKNIINRSKKMQVDGESGYGGYVVYLHGNKIQISNYKDLTPYSAQATDTEVKVSFNAPNGDMIIFSSEVNERFVDSKSFEEDGGIKYIFEPLTNEISEEILNKIAKFAEGGMMEGGGETDKKITFKRGDYFIVLKDMGKLKRFRIWKIDGNYVTINYSRYDGTDVYDSNETKSNLKYLLENGYIKKVNKTTYWNRKYENYAEGGKVKFKDKVASIKASLLKRKKVPKAVQKDYGKTYSPEEAQESAQRIVGAQTARERLMMRIKKGKKKK